MNRSGSRKIASCSIESTHDKLLLLSLWLDENPQINACKDPENLMFFLSSCKFDLDRTMKKLRTFYLMRAERTEWFSNRDPFLPEIQEILNLGVFLPIDGVDEKNRKVVIIRTSAHDPKQHTQNNVFKVSKMVLDLLLKFEPANCANGIVAIFDMKNVQLQHALQLNPRIIKRSVESWQAYPCQPKLLEFTNAPPYVNVVLNTFRMFMTSKMRSRVVVRKEGCSVKSPNIPKDIGGNGECYKDLTNRWKRIVETNAEFYVENDKYKSIIK